MQKIFKHSHFTNFASPKIHKNHHKSLMEIWNHPKLLLLFKIRIEVLDKVNAKLSEYDYVLWIRY